MKFIQKIIFLFSVLALISLDSSGQRTTTRAGISLDRLNVYETYIQNYVDQEKIPGAVSLVYRKGEIVYHNAHGFKDVTKKEVLTTDGLFFIQSMTKPIITAAFMMLYEEGHFMLNDPVSKYIPSFKDLKVAKDVSLGKNSPVEDLKTEVTIAHLLSHTAGLSHGLGGTALDRDYAITMYFQKHKTVQDRVNAMLSLPLVAQPGEKWYYSAAPDVLSVLIEKFSGMSTAEFLQKRIFDPLEMKNTGYNVPEEKQKHVVQVHKRKDSGGLELVENQPSVSGNTLWSGVNALFSTAEDYLKFCQMLLNNGSYKGQHLLSRKTIEIMTMNHTDRLYGDNGEGFGLGFAVVEDVAKTKLLGSEGIFYWSGANNTHFFIDPKEEMIAIFMTQLAPYDGVFHQRLRQRVMQAIVD